MGKHAFRQKQGASVRFLGLKAYQEIRTPCFCGKGDPYGNSGPGPIMKGLEHPPDGKPKKNL